MGTQANNALFVYLFYFLFIGSITLTYLRSRVSIIRNAHIYVYVCMCMYVCIYVYMCIPIRSDPIRFSDPIPLFGLFSSKKKTQPKLGQLRRS